MAGPPEKLEEVPEPIVRYSDRFTKKRESEPEPSEPIVRYSDRFTERREPEQGEVSVPEPTPVSETVPGEPEPTPPAADVDWASSSQDTFEVAKAALPAVGAVAKATFPLAGILSDAPDFLSRMYGEGPASEDVRRQLAAIKTSRQMAKSFYDARRAKKRREEARDNLLYFREDPVDDDGFPVESAEEEPRVDQVPSADWRYREDAKYAPLAIEPETVVPPFGGAQRFVDIQMGYKEDDLEEAHRYESLNTLVEMAKKGEDVRPLLSRLNLDFLALAKDSHPIARNLSDDELQTLFKDFPGEVPEWLTTLVRIKNADGLPPEIFGQEKIPLPDETAELTPEEIEKAEREIGPGQPGGSLAQSYVSEYYKAFRQDLLDKKYRAIAADKGLRHHSGEKDAGPYGAFLKDDESGLLWRAYETMSMEYLGALASPARFAANAIKDVSYLDRFRKIIDPDPNGTGYLGSLNAAAGATGNLVSEVIPAAVRDVKEGRALGNIRKTVGGAADIFTENFLDKDEGFKWQTYLGNEWHAMGAFLALPFHIVDGLGMAAHMWNSNAPVEDKLEATNKMGKVILDEMSRRYGRLLSLKSDVWEESAIFAGLDLAALTGIAGSLLRKMQGAAKSEALKIAGELKEVRKPLDPLDPLWFASKSFADDAGRLPSGHPERVRLMTLSREFEKAAGVVEKKIPVINRNWDSFNNDVIRDLATPVLWRSSQALGGAARAAEILTEISTKMNPLFGPSYLLGKISDGLMAGAMLASRHKLVGLERFTS